ncbi:MULTISPECIES: DUF4097 family beta strand repeat-containing protein [Priestia]|uniref:DUF4097 family beta strand repeat-containing protein n=1 Tax=Priestia TaxID=2800373 RepID=UPI0018A06879|nr:DUF4097 family beta strand repeat-containing protein [Priestia megaterium]
MKKIISTSLALALIGGFAFSSYDAEAKSFDKNKSYNAENINTLKVYSDSWDVRFKKSNSNEVTISAEGKQKGKEPVTFKTDGETLVIKQKDQKKSGFFGGFTFGKSGTIYINVPKSKINNIKLNNKNGDIELSKISAKNVTVKNNSGDEKIKGLNVENGKFSSSDGMLSFENSTFKSLKVVSASGDNYMENVSASKAKVSSKDGVVQIKGMKEGKSLAVKTTSGDIGVSYKKAPTSLTVDATSKSSDVNLKLDGYKKSSGSENSQSGKVGQGENILELTSNDGVINVKN